MSYGAQPVAGSEADTLTRAIADGSVVDVRFPSWLTSEQGRRLCRALASPRQALRSFSFIRRPATDWPNDFPPDLLEFEVARALARVRTLKVLHVDVMDVDLACAGAILRSTSIEDLHLGDGVSAACAVVTANELRPNTSLRRLSIQNSRFGNSGAVAMAASLCFNTTLEELSLTECNVCEEGALALAGALCVSRSLLSLSLHGSQIGTAGVTAIARSLRADSSLTSLDVGLGITATGAEELAAAMECAPALASISFECEAADTVARVLAGALRGNRTLRHLAMGGDALGDGGVMALARAVSVNTTLETLEIWWVTASPAAVGQLQREWASTRDADGLKILNA